MITDFYDIASEPIVTLEAFYSPKKHLVDKCIVIFLRLYMNICCSSREGDSYGQKNRSCKRRTSYRMEH